MPKVENRSGRDLGLTAEVMIPAGGSRALSPVLWASLSVVPVIAAWIRDGWLRPEPTEEEIAAEAAGKRQGAQEIDLTDREAVKAALDAMKADYDGRLATEKLVELLRDKTGASPDAPVYRIDA